MNKKILITLTLVLSLMSFSLVFAANNNTVNSRTTAGRVIDNTGNAVGNTAGNVVNDIGKGVGGVINGAEI